MFLFRQNTAVIMRFGPLFLLVLFHIPILGVKGWGHGQKVTDDTDYYTHIKPADLSDSYRRIKTMPMNHYEFIHDSIPGRRQLGVIAQDARRSFPEAVEVIPQYTVLNRDRTAEPKVLYDYPLIDKNIIFMHGMAAVQELAHRLDKLGESYQNTEDSKNKYKLLLEQIENKLVQELDAQAAERQLLADAELDAARKDAELERVRDEQQRIIIAAEIEAEKELLKYEEELARKRLELQEKLARDSMEIAISLERELAEKREAAFRDTAEALEKRKTQYSLDLERKKKDFEKEKIRAEIVAKAEQERANEDMEIRKMQTQSKLDTQRTLDMISSMSKVFKFLCVPLPLLSHESPN